MKINKISSKLIKPQTPTPQNLKNYNLSFIDKGMVAINIGAVLFYVSKPENYSAQLEESLAKILADFYPLAGRYIKSDLFVDCSDEGAEFVEAEAVDVELLDLVGTTEIEQLVPGHFFKVDEAPDDPLLSIQIIHFPCGGLVIGISISHRIFDASSVGTFLAAWSNATGNPDNKMVTISPTFDLPSLLPCRDNNDSMGSVPPSDRRLVAKRLLFDKAALARLRSRLRPEKTVSGVRVASAVVAKALIGVDRAKQGRSKDFVIFQPINMRERTSLHPQPKHSCGNLAIPMITRRIAASEAEHIGIQELVDLLGDAARNAISDHAGILSLDPDRDGRDILVNSFQRIIHYYCSSDTSLISLNDWSKFGFYEADFGWGRPVWTCTGPEQGKTALFISNKEGDGLEAWVYLDQDDVPYFDQDDDLKQFSP